ncbi:leucine-rich repeat domain-containing protein [Candidatus Cardinium hertigii]|uniref:Leucine-rich repeat domain-containing protein n=1 Tax=Candidatus Cardinium hertigii TaxID=247481 RepID=A0A2Z3L8M3_9BACT|nr:leucine-rich repeat domain-containing protein [Candidatus Cardinium hertigii]AWN81933.1 hypothetical protein DK880_00617 [Candidatus Cardinium hertigii]
MIDQKPFRRPFTDLIIEGKVKVNKDTLRILFQKLDDGVIYSLKYLCISGNQLTSIEIPSLPKLENLNLSFNQLRSVNGLLSLSRLIELNIGDNQLTSIEIPSL